MSEFKKKSFADISLYEKEKDNIDKRLLDFIINADRIDKKSEQFRGIIDEVKRVQRTSVINSILVRDDIILCIAKDPLARAFKVFEAKDVRTDRSPKIFIDCTKLIEYRDGYFVCKRLDVFITYLFNALGYLTYSKATIKLITNSNITITGTECFVNLFNYIPDYLRIIGYKENKEKISYLAGLYFIKNIMNKELDIYSKNVAAKIAGIPNVDVRAYDLYYKDEDFDNIENFILMIQNTFKLKGFTLEVFLHRWNFAFGNGTYYATELFPEFIKLITSAYCQSYIVGQKQIGLCCGAGVVKFTNALVQLATSEFDKRGMRYEEYNYIDPNSRALAEGFIDNLKKNKILDNAKLTDEVLKSKSKAKDATNNLIKYYESIGNSEKIDKQLYIWVATCTGAMIDYIKGKNTYEIGVMTAILSTGKKYLSNKSKKMLNNVLRGYEADFASTVNDKDNDKNFGIEKHRSAQCLVEVRKCLAYV